MFLSSLGHLAVRMRTRQAKFERVRTQNQLVRRSRPLSREVLLDSKPANALTKPNGSIPYGERPRAGASNTYFGQGQIWTSFWPDSVVTFTRGGPGDIRPDGSLAIKWPWWRFIPGELTIEGRRLDGHGELRAIVPTEGYAQISIQPSVLIFSGPGCWQVTGSIDGARLTFVTAVVLP